MTASIHIDHDRTQRKGMALGMSVLVHLLILVLLFLLKIVTPIPPYPEGGGEGMEMGIADLGFSDEGMGNTESMDASAPAPSESASSAEESAEELITEDDGEQVNTPPKTDQKKPVVTPPRIKPPKITEPTVNPNALFKPSNNPAGGNSDGSGGDGNSNTPGNVGVPGGDPSGSGRGGWGDWRLSGRGLGRGPNITERPSEGGKVVLNIWVDRAGKVLRVAPNLTKSTTNSQTLFNIAKKAALQCTFTPKADAAAEQVGEMTFVFILE